MYKYPEHYDPFEKVLFNALAMEYWRRANFMDARPDIFEVQDVVHHILEDVERILNFQPSGDE